MEDEKSTEKVNNITLEFRKVIEAEKIQKIRNNVSQNNQTGKSDNDILSRLMADISQESLVQGLVYSEIFGQPKCKRRGR